MLLETVEDNGLRAIEKPADSGEETRREQQGQTKLGSAAAQRARRCKTSLRRLHQSSSAAPLHKKRVGFKPQFKLGVFQCSLRNLSSTGLLGRWRGKQLGQEPLAPASLPKSCLMIRHPFDDFGHLSPSVDPIPLDAPTPLTDFILLSGGLHGEPDLVWKLHLGNGFFWLVACLGFVCF